MKEFLVWTIIIIVFAVGICVASVNRNDITDSDNYEIVEFTHKNHDYMFVKIGTGGERIGGLVHDPDCKFCNE